VLAGGGHPADRLGWRGAGRRRTVLGIIQDGVVAGSPRARRGAADRTADNVRRRLWAHGTAATPARVREHLRVEKIARPRGHLVGVLRAVWTLRGAARRAPVSQVEVDEDGAVVGEEVGHGRAVQVRHLIAGSAGTPRLDVVVDDVRPRVAPGRG